MKKFALIILAFAFTAGTALAQNDLENPQKQKELVKELVKMETMIYNYTPEQATKIEALHHEYGQKEITLYKQYNFKTVDEMNKATAYKKQLKTIRDERVQKMKAILTAAQFKEYQAANTNEELLK